MTECHHPLVASGTASADLLLLFLTGLGVSLGHCVGMCGPLQTAFVARQSAAGSGKTPVGAVLRYHAARVSGYVLLGAAFGLVGSATRLGGSLAWQGALALFAGVIILLTGLGFIRGSVATWVPATWTDAWTRRVSGWLRGTAPRHQTAMGFANALLPCGPVYAVLLAAAAAAHVGVGMLLMGVYGAGTLPVLVVLGLLATRIPAAWRTRLVPLAAWLVALVGLQLLLRGAATLGWVPHAAWGPVVLW